MSNITTTQPTAPTAVASKQKTWGEQLEERSSEFEKALSGRIPKELFIRAALSTINRSPKLLQCHATTIYQSLLDAATLGLLPDNTLGYCFLIAYGKDAKLQLGYKGLSHLMRKEAGVKEIDAEVVYEKDEFSYELGSNKSLRHVPNFLVEDRGKKICAWCMVKGADGQIDFRILPMKRLREIRAMSKSPNSDAWLKSEDEMWRKTVLINLTKTQSLSPEIKTIIERENEAEFGRTEQPTPTAITVTGKPDLSKTKVTDMGNIEDASFSDTTEPEGPSNEPDTTHQHELAMTVLDVSERSGNKDGKPWTRYTIKLSDGNDYGTFDSNIANAARDIKDEGLHCVVDAKPSQRGNGYDLLSIESTTVGN